MKGTITVLLLIWCAVVVLGCGNEPEAPRPQPKYQPNFVGCPGDITKLPDPGTLTTDVSWTPPTARSRNDGNRRVAVTRVGGPSPGSTFQAGSPVKIRYKALESNDVPPSYCSFYVTVEARYCDPLPALNHGTRTCSGSRDNIYGSVCTHTCSAGYKVNGPDTITCKNTRQWDKSAPLCEPVSCGAPGNIDNGSTVCFRGYTYSEMCSTACNSGYMHSGSPFITCGANGVWSNADPCVDKEPPTFPNGCPDNQVLYTGPLERPVAVFWTDSDTNDNSGQSVTLTSTPARGSFFGPGFYLFRITATDMASNAASCTFVVDIKSRECDAITAPANSRVTCSRGYVEGSECMVTCNRGYDIQGQALLTCLQSEQWNVALPTCVAGGCSTPPTVENGVFRCSSGQTYLATCDLVCDAGFEVQNPPYIQCTYNGTWTTPGSCADTEPPVFPQDCPDNIEIYAASLGQPNLVTWAPPDVTDNSGKAVELVSDIQPGSNFSVGVTRVKYKATDVNGNSKKCSFTVTVNTAVCPVPNLQPSTTQHTRMLYDCPDGHVYGASCALNCTHGYPLVGSDTITCQRDDSTFPPTMTWYWAGSAVPPECTNTQCPELEAPKNGALSCNRGNFGVDCLMSCNVRYDVPAKLPLDGHIYCNSAGWHPSSVPDCTVPVRPGGARLHSDLAYFTGSCNVSLDELKQNFITRMQNSTVLRDACTNVPTCTVDNVKMPKHKPTRPGPAAQNRQTRPSSKRATKTTTGEPPASTSAQAEAQGTPPPWMAQLLQALDGKIETAVQAAIAAQVRDTCSTPQLNQMGPAHTEAPTTSQEPEPQHLEDLATQACTAATFAATQRIAGTSGGFTSATLGLPSLVPLKIKQKIWAGEFVELKSLLPSKGQDSFRLEVSSGEGSPTLQLLPNQSQASLSMAQWIKAWNRYVAVLTLQKPQASPGLAHHMETVLSLADKKANWAFYDENYRQLVAMQEAQWGSIHMELYMKAVLDPQQPQQQVQQQRNAGQRAQTPRGACFRYHVRGQCPAGLTCPFQHKCYRCLGAHPASHCSVPMIGKPKILSKFSDPRIPASL